MNKFNHKKFAFEHAWNNICEASCEEHKGKCKVVHVTRPGQVPLDCWHFSYCDEAIAEDRRRGFNVEVLNIVEESV
jgi:hypothetical protein